MSYILDALNKSEQERREQENVPSLQAIHEDSVHGHTRAGLKRWLPIALASLILILLAVILLMWFSRGEANVSSLDAPGLAAGARDTVTSAAVRGNSDVTYSVAEPLAARTFDSDPQGPAVSSLYDQATSEPVQTTAVPAIVSPEQQALSRVVQAERVRAQIGGPESLPAALRSHLPTLDYSAHVYSSDESSGFAIINGRSRYKGDLLSNSLFVEAVEEDGVLLNIQGLSFKLKAMKSWPPQ